MPTLEFRCKHDHVVEQFFKTISAGEGVEEITCPSCGEKAQKIFSTPLGFGLYGSPDGYHKPSPTKRFNTKTVSQLTGNKDSVG